MSIFSSIKHLDAYGRLTGSFYQLNLIYRIIITMKVRYKKSWYSPKLQYVDAVEHVTEVFLPASLLLYGTTNSSPPKPLRFEQSIYL